MQIFNALQLKNGAKAKQSKYPATSSLTQPIQFLSAKKEKCRLGSMEFGLVRRARNEFPKKEFKKALKEL